MKNKLIDSHGGFHTVMLLFFVTMFMGVHLSLGQYFDPNVDDKTYLDNIQAEVLIEVKSSKSELMEEAKIIQGVTRRYIGAKLKENIFKALRLLAEKELETISMQERPRQPRLQTEEEGGEEEEEAGGAAAAGAAGAEATTRRGLIPQLALILKAIFGGNNVNATKYVESASTFLPRPLGNQLIGVVSLLERNRQRATLPPPPPAISNNLSNSVLIIEETTPRPRVRVYSTTPYRPVRNPTIINIATQKPIPGVRPGEDDEEESFKRARQVKIPGLSILGNIFKGIRSGNTNVTTAVPATTTESLSGFEEEKAEANKVGMAALVDGIRDQIDDLRQNIPDIFQGAREAYKLLETVSGLFERLGEKNPVNQTL